MSYTIKSGNLKFDLINGDEVLDNGSYYQLISRKIRKGLDFVNPRISKKEFEKFIKLPNLHKIKRVYPSGMIVTIYRYVE